MKSSVAATLQKFVKGEPTESELTSGIRKISDRQAEVDARLKAITDNGDVLNKAIESGDPDAVITLEQEAKALRVEYQQLYRRKQELIDQRKRARVREIGPVIESLEQEVSEAERAREDLAIHLAAVDRLSEQIKSVRQGAAAVKLGRDAVSVPAELAQRVALLLVPERHEAVKKHCQGRTVADERERLIAEMASREEK